MVAEAERRWGKVDILVNNAGILRDKTFGKMEMADFELVVKVHLLGSAICARAVWNGMRERNYGRIVFTSSASGIYGNFGQANYGAAKAGDDRPDERAASRRRRSTTCASTRSRRPRATQMTEGLLPTDAAAVLTAESVTPAVLFLVGEDAPSRVIMGAGGGVFAVTHIAETPGVYLAEGRAHAGDDRGALCAKSRTAARRFRSRTPSSRLSNSPRRPPRQKGGQLNNVRNLHA